MMCLSSQFAAYVTHLANMAPSSTSSKRLVISLETKITEKDNEILTLKDSVNVKDEQLRLSSEREIQASNKLSAVEAKIVELEEKLEKEIEETVRFKSLLHRKMSKK